jgi:hypothetical protein
MGEFQAVVHAPAHPWRMKRRLLRAATVRERIRLLTRAALSEYLFSKQRFCAAINDGFTVDQNLGCAIISSDLFDIDALFSFNPSRHTDGMYPRDSKAAVLYFDSCFFCLARDIAVFSLRIPIE